MKHGDGEKSKNLLLSACISGFKVIIDYFSECSVLSVAKRIRVYPSAPLKTASVANLRILLDGQAVAVYDI